MHTACSFLYYTDIHIWSESALFLHYLYLFFQLTVYRASGSLHTVLKWGLECCGWRKRVREKWRAGKRLRSVCPVRLLPLHNLWAAGADHHGSVPRVAPGAAWDRPVNWMLCSCWARKAPFLPSRNRPPQKQTSYEPSQPPLSTTGPQISKNKRCKQKQKGEKMAGLSVAHSLGCQSFHPLPSLPPSFNRQPPTPPRLHTNSLCQPLPIFPPSAFFITDSSASLHLSHMHNVEGRQSPSITLISW